MPSFHIHEAKTELSKLIRRVRAGEEIIIADAGTPVARLVPIEQPKTARTLGADRGKIWIAPDAFAPLAGDELAAWNGALLPESAPAPEPRSSSKPSRSPRRKRLAARPHSRR